MGSAGTDSGCWAGLGTGGRGHRLGWGGAGHRGQAVTQTWGVSGLGIELCRVEGVPFRAGRGLAGGCPVLVCH